MAVQIQIRRYSAADWTSTDPTLALGEMGYETDTGKFKIGDGATAWTALAYSGWFAKTIGIADNNILEVDDARLGLARPTRLDELKERRRAALEILLGRILAQRRLRNGVPNGLGREDPHLVAWLNAAC